MEENGSSGEVAQGAEQTSELEDEESRKTHTFTCHSSPEPSSSIQVPGSRCHIPRNGYS